MAVTSAKKFLKNAKFKAVTVLYANKQLLKRDEAFYEPLWKFIKYSSKLDAVKIPFKL